MSQQPNPKQSADNLADTAVEGDTTDYPSPIYDETVVGLGINQAAISAAFAAVAREAHEAFTTAMGAVLAQPAQRPELPAVPGPRTRSDPPA